MTAESSSKSSSSPNGDKTAILRIQLEKTDFKNIFSFTLKNGKVHVLTSNRKATLIKEQKNKLILIATFLDEDIDEIIYSALIHTINNTQYFIYAGEVGIIKFINLDTNQYEFALKGHGSSISELRLHIYSDGIAILFSGSNDTSAKAWNITARKCIATYGGLVGHRESITSIDVSLCGQFLLTGGADCLVKVWDLSDLLSNKKYRKNKKTHNMYFPIYSSAELTKSAVEYAKFYGKFIVSKGVLNKINVVAFNRHEDFHCNSHNSDSIFVKEIDLMKNDYLNMGLDKHTFFYQADNKKLMFHNLLDDTTSQVLSARQSNIKCFNVLERYVYILYEDDLFVRVYRR